LPRGRLSAGAHEAGRDVDLVRLVRVLDRSARDALRPRVRHRGCGAMALRRRDRNSRGPAREPPGVRAGRDHARPQPARVIALPLLGGRIRTACALLRGRPPARRAVRGVRARGVARLVDADRQRCTDRGHRRADARPVRDALALAVAVFALSQPWVVDLGDVPASLATRWLPFALVTATVLAVVLEGFLPLPERASFFRRHFFLYLVVPLALLGLRSTFVLNAEIGAIYL